MTVSSDRALAPRPAAQIQPRQDDAAPLAQQVSARSLDPELLAQAAAIFVQALGTGGITPEQAIGAALHFKTTGEIMGRESYVGTQGAVKGQVIEGYRAIERRIKQDYQVQYRSLTNAEIEEHGVMAGDKSLACEVYLLDSWRKCIKMGVPYRPIVGITVIRKDDRQQVPKTKTLRWVLEKQARKDALRQVPGLAVTTEEVLDAAEEAGIEIETDGLQLQPEQAALLVEAKVQQAQLPERTPEEAKQRLQANVNAMRGDPQDDPFADEPPPSDEFDALPKAPLSKSPSAPAQPQLAPAEPPRELNTAPNTITQAQLDESRALVEQIYPSRDARQTFAAWLRETFNVDLRQKLSEAQAAQMIAALKETASTIGH